MIIEILHILNISMSIKGSGDKFIINKKTKQNNNNNLLNIIIDIQLMIINHTSKILLYHYYDILNILIFHLSPQLFLSPPHNI